MPTNFSFSSAQGRNLPYSYKKGLLPPGAGTQLTKVVKGVIMGECECVILLLEAVVVVTLRRSIEDGHDVSK